MFGIGCDNCNNVIIMRMWSVVNWMEFLRCIKFEKIYKTKWPQLTLRLCILVDMKLFNLPRWLLFM